MNHNIKRLLNDCINGKTVFNDGPEGITHKNALIMMNINTVWASEPHNVQHKVNLEFNVNNSI